jgi:hypothetical protein
MDFLVGRITPVPQGLVRELICTLDSETEADFKLPIHLGQHSQVVLLTVNNASLETRWHLQANSAKKG